jgi:hypothetical protein
MRRLIRDYLNDNGVKFVPTLATKPRSGKPAS